MHHLMERAQSKAEFLSDVAPEAIFNLDFLYLETLMRQTSKDKEITYSLVIDPTGKPLTQYINHADPQIASITATLGPDPTILDAIATLNQASYIHQIRIPVTSNGQPLGEVLLGYSAQHVQQDSRNAAWITLTTAIIISTLLAVLSVIAFQRQVHQPLKELAHFAHAFESGEFSQRTTIQQNDEIGQLGRALNQMAQKLQNTLIGLAEARDEAIIANQAKSEFLANMSHELRTPLNAILGFSELMTLEPSTSPEQQKTLEIIHRSGENLLSLINDILEMTRIEAGQTIVTPTNFDLYHLLKTMRTRLQKTATGKGLDLIFDYSPNLPQYIRADDKKLRQILLNLLDNAIKFTEVGSIKLQVNATPQVKITPLKATDETHHQHTLENSRCSLAIQQLQTSTHTIQVTITDTGPGIDPADHSKLFDPFTKTDIGRKSQTGSGLGLSICQKYLQLMGGDITLTSQLGQGSIFKVSVPIQSITAQDVNLSNHDQRQIISLAKNQPQYRILIVGHPQDDQQLLIQRFKLIGFEVQLAANGLEGIEIWQTWNPHLIWMTKRMPAMDGLETTRHIRELEHSSPQRKDNQPTVIIMPLPDIAFEQHHQTALNAGCTDAIRKPFQETEVFEKIQQHLNIQYCYENSPKSRSTQSPSSDIKASTDVDHSPSTANTITERSMETQLVNMSPEWRNALYQASRELDAGTVNRLITQIPEECQTLILTLQKWANSFQFDKITHITQNNLE